MPEVVCYYGDAPKLSIQQRLYVFLLNEIK